jgi:hypothetical protein
MGNAGLGCQLVGLGSGLGAANEDAGSGVPEEIFNLVTLVGIVQWEVYGASPQAAKVEGNCLWILSHLHCNTVTRLDPQRNQKGGKTGGFLPQRTVADHTTVGEYHARRIGVGRKAGLQGIIEVLIHITLSITSISCQSRQLHGFAWFLLD